ncbi:hypothetical protein SERLA73DRAFT_171053 [Serpula lacrymans var. lacrymans S7.3]|uniref:Methyltransferase-domain-containing protein n=2 Tax=Serpula lacrymans var. lacrymans TaxID=341189 RepID=F8Q9H0_SERL3|nr:uncharacterized protein SERLADRAFT_477241 [Serpula lacrymans var. lacrymans S7.9]EGN95225.1 hypothetical protein SERLA73DRAFT_171053 [Serpula lacrymans var. lacrymans S7.3]EGO20754.1 hypothetical protein SERLADRAFT_477241 [Serpula lacrymans var. lacrymans S7.9]
MFYYISFLRPPPLQAALSGSISITPQVANDLRTEPFDGAQDIFYCWSATSTTPVATKPTKLTTWRQSNAYKELSVPLPPNLRSGQSWRLVLSSRAHGQVSSIQLDEDALGDTPFPVISMPIVFSPRPGKAVKQEQVERIYNLLLKSNDDPLSMVIREQTSFDLDKKIWDSGIGLSSWILRHYNHCFENTAPLTELHRRLFGSKHGNIIELGAGTGIVALTLAILRSSTFTEGFEAPNRLITTDLSSAMPLLERNISSNGHLFPLARPEAVVLDWDNEELPPAVHDLENGLDVIVMADVTYNTSSFPSLIRTLSSLIEFSMTKNAAPPLILLGYKERDLAERTLWGMASEIGISLEKVSELAGAGGAPIEIWVGQAKNKSDQ